MGNKSPARVLAAGAGALVLTACAGGTPGSAPPPSASSVRTVPSGPPASPLALSASPSPSPSAAPFDPSAAHGTVTRLADLGPREATGEAFATAANHVADELSGHGYRVTRQEFDVPAGTSWGVRVPAGRTHNVIADLPGFDPAAPHVVIGAHLDSVPQSPGAEDNASGVAVLLELARMSAEEPPVLPVRFIAFGAEEPRGPGDDRHHYGSRHYVAELDETGRSAITAMVSLDRVGVPSPAVPLAYGGRGDDGLRQALADSAPADIRVTLVENTTSDHWSFEKAGIPAARLGSVPYAAYHTRNDTPEVVDPAQLGRTGAAVWAWLRDP